MTKLERWDTFEDGVRRLILEQLDEMGRMPDSSEDAVHDLRVGCKKIRAWLRLLRDTLGDEAYEFENRTFRDMARRLSGQRDAEVLHESVEALREAFPDDTHADDITAARNALPRSEGEGGDSAVIMTDITGQIAEARQRISERALNRGGAVRPLKQAFRRSCRQEKKARRTARRTPVAENLHEWRKRVKALHYQLKLVHDVWPKRIEAMDAALRTLAKSLGRHHDLAVLEEQLLASHVPLPPQRLQSIRRLIHHQLEAAGRKAIRQGQGLSRHTCAPFVRRLGKRWRKWEG